MTITYFENKQKHTQKKNKTSILKENNLSPILGDMHRHLFFHKKE